jgi:hypothetical protein
MLMPSHFCVPACLHKISGAKSDEVYSRMGVSSAPRFFIIWLLHISSHYVSFHQSISAKVNAFTTLICFSTYSTHCSTYTLPWSTQLRLPKPCPPLAIGQCPKSVTRTSGPTVRTCTVVEYSRTVYRILSP